MRAKHIIVRCCTRSHITSSRDINFHNFTEIIGVQSEIILLGISDLRFQAARLTARISASASKISPFCGPSLHTGVTGGWWWWLSTHTFNNIIASHYQTMAENCTSSAILLWCLLLLMDGTIANLIFCSVHNIFNEFCFVQDFKMWVTI